MAFTEYESLNAVTLSDYWTRIVFVFKSKRYCKGIELTYEVVPKDGKIYCKGYIEKLDFSCLQYS
jgi:hypothetical protein